MRNIKKNCDIVHILSSASQTAGTIKTKLVDVAGCNRVLFSCNVGVYTVGTGTGVTWSLVEGDTTADASLTAVNSANYEADSLTLCTSASNDETTVRIEYRPHGKRYVGANIVVSSGSGSCLLSCDAITFFHEDEPVTPQTAIERT